MKYYKLCHTTAVECSPADGLKGFEGDRQVARTEFADGVVVSTVFLVFDHGFISGGPPVLFETMIFGGPLDGVLFRASTWHDALLTHGEALARVGDAEKIPGGYKVSFCL